LFLLRHFLLQEKASQLRQILSVSSPERSGRGGELARSYG
jgi:hypothetical protein